MQLQDALFNWLQIKVVSDNRPNDAAAKETMLFFEDILTADHSLEQFAIGNVDETMYYVNYVKDGKKKTQLFDRERVEQLLDDIAGNPKYNE